MFNMVFEIELSLHSSTVLHIVCVNSTRPCLLWPATGNSLVAMLLDRTGVLRCVGERAVMHKLHPVCSMQHFFTARKEGRDRCHQKR